MEWFAHAPVAVQTACISGVISVATITITLFFSNKSTKRALAIQQEQFEASRQLDLDKLQKDIKTKEDDRLFEQRVKFATETLEYFNKLKRADENPDDLKLFDNIFSTYEDLDAKARLFFPKSVSDSLLELLLEAQDIEEIQREKVKFHMENGQSIDEVLHNDEDVMKKINAQESRLHSAFDKITNELRGILYPH